MLVVFSEKQVEISITCYFSQVKACHSHINDCYHLTLHGNSVYPDQPVFFYKFADLDPHCLQRNLNICSER